MVRDCLCVTGGRERLTNTATALTGQTSAVGGDAKPGGWPAGVPRYLYLSLRPRTPGM